MIKKLLLNNFKCFRNIEIDMAPLNIFTGINSMGKSSVIQAFLLLRQAYDLNCLDKGIQLNGSLVNIGNGSDLLNRESDIEKIGIELVDSNQNFAFEYVYNGESDFQKLVDTSLDLSSINLGGLFRPNFSYISAERIGPQRYYQQSYNDVYEKKQISSRGELFVDYLAELGLTQKVENKHVLHPEVKSDYLLYQMEGWLSEISPGLKLDTQKFKEAGIVGLTYGVGSEKYTPINVGFGISYVAPIILSLLKAIEGDVVVIENPEAHLHPKGQRKIGELIALSAQGGVQVIVETHSDHLLNGVRLAVKNNKIDSSSVRLNYFYLDKNESGKIYHTKKSPAILKDGRLSDWPEGFFDEWDKALDELL